MIHLKQITINQAKFPTRDVYPFQLGIFQNTEAIDIASPITFFVGENGAGKSTLLKALSKKSGVHIWNDTTSYSRYEHNPFEDSLDVAIQLTWSAGRVPGSFFGAQIFQHFARLLDDWAKRDPGILEYFGGASLLTQSHGQSLMSFFRSRYQVEGIYFVDEPETALSPKSQIELIRVLRETGLNGPSQFIIATHSPILLACPDSTIFSFDQERLQTITYEETEYFKVYKDFLNNRHAYL